MKEFTGEELQEIASIAMKLARREILETSINYSLWKRAYEKLADAAWNLDALLVREKGKGRIAL